MTKYKQKQNSKDRNLKKDTSFKNDNWVILIIKNGSYLYEVPFKKSIDWYRTYSSRSKWKLFHFIEGGDNETKQSQKYVYTDVWVYTKSEIRSYYDL